MEAAAGWVYHAEEESHSEKATDRAVQSTPGVRSGSHSPATHLACPRWIMQGEFGVLWGPAGTYAECTVFIQ